MSSSRRKSQQESSFDSRSSSAVNSDSSRISIRRPYSNYVPPILAVSEQPTATATVRETGSIVSSDPTSTLPEDDTFGYCADDQGEEQLEGGDEGEEELQEPVEFVETEEQGSRKRPRVEFETEESFNSDSATVRRSSRQKKRPVLEAEEVFNDTSLAEIVQSDTEEVVVDEPFYMETDTEYFDSQEEAKEYLHHPDSGFVMRGKQSSLSIYFFCRAYTYTGCKAKASVKKCKESGKYYIEYKDPHNCENKNKPGLPWGRTKPRPDMRQPNPEIFAFNTPNLTIPRCNFFENVNDVRYMASEAPNDGSGVADLEATDLTKSGSRDTMKNESDGQKIAQTDTSKPLESSNLRKYILSKLVAKQTLASSDQKKDRISDGDEKRDADEEVAYVDDYTSDADRSPLELVECLWKKYEDKRISVREFVRRLSKLSESLTDQDWNHCVGNYFFGSALDRGGQFVDLATEISLACFPSSGFQEAAFIFLMDNLDLLLSSQCSNSRGINLCFLMGKLAVCQWPETMLICEKNVNKILYTVFFAVDKWLHGLDKRSRSSVEIQKICAAAMLSFVHSAGRQLWLKWPDVVEKIYQTLPGAIVTRLGVPQQTKSQLLDLHVAISNWPDKPSPWVCQKCGKNLMRSETSQCGAQTQESLVDRNCDPE